METTARIYNCVRCHRQVVLCSHCDRGNIYCFGECSQQARQDSCRDANRRYRQSRKGRFNAALRQAKYRRQQQQDLALDPAPEQKVTHHGSTEDPTSVSITVVSEKSSLLQKHATAVGPSDLKVTIDGETHCHCCGRTVSPYLRSRYMRQRHSAFSDPL